MNRGKFFAAAALAALATGTGVGAQNAGGPIATYWVTAETSSGMSAMMGGGGPAMAAAMMGGGAPNSGTLKTLHLDLGSTRKAAGTPSAEHLVPSQLRVGPSLPLVTPVYQANTNRDTTYNDIPREMPKGKILIYWGCGAKAGPNQPAVVDFSKLGAGQQQAFGTLSAKGQTPPSPQNSATYGGWPNEKARVTVPANGSLIGDHVIRGNYSPEIKFTLGAGQDFLAPLKPITSPDVGGATLINWRSVPTAKAYIATVMGSRPDGTLVMWSSSTTRLMGMGLPDYMDEPELQRLVTSGVLMGPSATTCTVPAEVTANMPGAAFQMTAFGPQSNFSYPPKPANAEAWKPEWVAKLRSKSTHMAMLGMDMPDMSAAAGQGVMPTPSAMPGNLPIPGRKRGLLGAIGKAVVSEALKR